MIADIGRNPCVMSAPNGQVFAFYNSTIINKDTISYIDGGFTKYQLIFGEAEKAGQFRALHYSRFLVNGSLGIEPRLVPYMTAVDESGTGGSGNSGSSDKGQTSRKITTQPLYEVITPTIGNLPGIPGSQFMFWTNLKDKSNTLEKDSTGSFIYDPSKILRFESDKLEEVDLDNYSIKLLCSALITWELLKASGGNANDTKPVYTPIVKAIYILLVQEGNIAIDFSGGGMGGGMRRHNHADNNNAGFAYAVFAPGTSLQPINWK